MAVETGEFCPEKDELLRSIDYVPPEKPWMETKPVFKKGTYCFAAREKHQNIWVSQIPESGK